MSNIPGSKHLSILTQYNGRCAYCGNLYELTVDHLTPKCRGGTNAYDNVVPACYDCNQAKDNLNLEEFRTEIKIRKTMTSLNQKLRNPIPALWNKHWCRTLNRFGMPVVFWSDKH